MTQPRFETSCIELYDGEKHKPQPIDPNPLNMTLRVFKRCVFFKAHFIKFIRKSLYDEVKGMVYNMGLKARFTIWDPLSALC